MKKNVRTLFFIFNILIGFSYAQQEWPTTNTQISIAGSFGTFEDGVFHDGIDISGVPNQTFLKAIADGVIIDIYDQKNAINIVVRISPGVYVIYSHCEQLVNGIPLYTGAYPHLQISNFIGIGTQLTKGQIFATIADHNLAKTTNDHVHFSYQAGPNWSIDNLNPLEQLLANGNVDPGNVSPKFGPLYILNYESTLISQNQFQNIISRPMLYRKVGVVREITDNQGVHIPNKTSNSTVLPLENDAWPLSPSNNVRLDGVISAPYKIRFSIKDNLTNSVLPEESISFTGNPLATSQMILLYNTIKRGVGVNPFYLYCYNLTNINNINKVEDKYWNTALKKGELWNGVSASSIEEAQFPDGKYYLNMTADDLNPSHTVSESVEVQVDNFKPYVKKVEVLAKNTLTQQEHSVYNAEWIWTSNVGLVLTPQKQSERITGEVNPSKENVLIKVTFSEPMKLQGMNLDIKSSDNSSSLSATLVDGAVGDKEFVWSANGSDLLSASLLQNIHISANDLAGNDLIGYSELRTKYSIQDIPSRQANYSFSSPALSPTAIVDQTHHFNISGCNNGQNHRVTSACVDADFLTYDNTNITTGQSIHFLDNTDGIVTSWQWDVDGDNVVDYTTQNPTHTYNLPGNYTVRLTASDGTTSATETKTNYIRVSAPGTNALVADFTTSTSASIYTGQAVNFLNQTTGGSGNLSYYWNFTGGNPLTSTSPNPQNIFYSTVGDYAVELTVTDANGSTTKTKTSYIHVSNASVDPLLYSVTADQVNVAVGQNILFCSEAFFPKGGIQTYSYDGWNFGDNVISDPNLTCAVHYYTTPGTFNACRKVRDSNSPPSETTACKTIVVNSPSSISLDFTASSQQAVFGEGITMQAIVNEIYQTGSTNYTWKFTSSTNSSNVITFTGGASKLITGLTVGTWHVELLVSTPYASGSVTKNDYIVINTPATLTVSGGINMFTCDNNNPPFLQGPTPSGGVVCASNQTSSASPHPGQVYAYGYSWSSSDGNVFVTPSEPETFLDLTKFVNKPRPYTFIVNLYVSDCTFPTKKYENFSTQITLTNDITISASNMQLCPGASAQAQLSVTGGTGSGTYKYFWQPSTGLSCIDCASPIITAQSAGQITYTVSVSDARFFCATPATKTFTLTSSPVVANAGADKSVCINSVVSIGSVATGGSGVYTYSWSPALNLNCVSCATPTFKSSVSGTTTYTLTVVDGSGCTATDIVAVNVGNTFPKANGSNDFTSCPGASVTLAANASEGTGNYNFKWQASGNSNVLSTASTAFVEPFVTTTYNLMVTDNNGCTSTDKVTVFIDQSKAPVADAGQDKISCENSGATLTATATGGQPPYTFWWSNGKTEATISTPYSNSTYTVTITDANNCKSKDVVAVSKQPKEWEFRGDGIVKYICKGESVPVIEYIYTPATFTTADGPLYYKKASYPGYEVANSLDFTFSWSPNIGLDDPTKMLPIATPPNTKAYNLLITDQYGCTKYFEGLGNHIKVFEQLTPDIELMSDCYPSLCIDFKPNVVANTTSVENPWLLLLGGNTITSTKAFFPASVGSGDNGCYIFNTSGEKQITYTVNSQYCPPVTIVKNFILRDPANRSNASTICPQIDASSSVNSIDAVMASALSNHLTVECSNGYIKAPQKAITFTASSEIIIKPDVLVESGAEFKTHIDPCFTSSSSQFPLLLGGVLYTSEGCGTFPVPDDTLLLSFTNGAIENSVPYSITSSTGAFSFTNTSSLDQSTKYRIVTKSGWPIIDTLSRTIGEWTSLSPLFLTIDCNWGSTRLSSSAVLEKERKNKSSNLEANILKEKEPLKAGVYPNPNNGKFIFWTDEKTFDLNSSVRIIITDVIGNVVYTSILQSSNIELNLEQPTGIYHYYLNSDREILSKGKIAIIK